MNKWDTLNTILTDIGLTELLEKILVLVFNLSDLNQYNPNEAWAPFIRLWTKPL